MNDSYPGTRLRAFRISDELYDRAKVGAARRGLSLSEVVRGALEEVASDETATPMATNGPLDTE